MERTLLAMHMPQRFGRVFLVLALQSVCTSVGAEAAERYEWKQEEVERGVAMYTSDVPSHSLKVKGVATLPIAAEPLFMTLYDFERYPSWYHGCDEVRVLHSPASVGPIALLHDGEFGEITPGGPWLLFFRQQAGPLDDRWTLLRCTYRAGPNRTLLVEFESTEHDSYRAPANTVRMRVKGSWTLKPLDKSHTLVTFMLDVDPHTFAPAFIVNRVLRETVFETLMGLSRTARKASAPNRDGSAAVAH